MILQLIPRPRFNGLEIRRTLNFCEIAADDYAAYNIFLQDILNEIVDFSRLMAGDDGFINVSLQGESLPTDINAVLTQIIIMTLAHLSIKSNERFKAMQMWAAILHYSYAYRWHGTGEEEAVGS